MSLSSTVKRILEGEAKCAHKGCKEGAPYKLNGVYLCGEHKKQWNSAGIKRRKR